LGIFRLAELRQISPWQGEKDPLKRPLPDVLAIAWRVRARFPKENE
jgi:hypothetical protein